MSKNKKDRDEDNFIPETEFPKISKLIAKYVEFPEFAHADTSKGYFCASCTFFWEGHDHCAIVLSKGESSDGKNSTIIAPYGMCALWQPNYDVISPRKHASQKERPRKREARISKKRAGYFEIDAFKNNNDLEHGYFCYNCIYFINLRGGKCAIVKSEGEDCYGNKSGIIAPHGYCALWAPNHDMIQKKIH
jgi:hypothetical protein